MSRLSWAIVLGSLVLLFWAVLDPSPAEMAALLALDLGTTLIFRRYELGLFIRYWRTGKISARALTVSEVERASPEERVSLIEALLRMPAERAKFRTIATAIRILPNFALILYGWSYPHPVWIQALLAASICSFMLMFGYQAVLIENHIRISDWIKELHQRLDLTETFRVAKVSDPSGLYELRSLRYSLLIPGVMLWTQTALIFADTISTSHHLAARVALIGALGLALFGRNFFMAREYIYRGLSDLIGVFEKVAYPESVRTLPLRTPPVLTRFEQTLNQLVDRLRSKERELSTLMLEEAEKARFRSLGEMSAILVHDLSGPLHVAQFAATQLIEGKLSPDKARSYHTHLTNSLNRAIQLTQALRSRVQAPLLPGRHCRFGDAHRAVIDQMQGGFSLREFIGIRFLLDPRAEAAGLTIPQVDLMHILDNLYRNAARDLTEHSHPDPEIRIELGPDSAESLTELLITDNGSGLSSSEYERLTSYAIEQREAGAHRRSLGLFLTRRLVELNGGSLRVVDRAQGEQPSHQSGTVFSLRLRPGAGGAEERAS